MASIDPELVEEHNQRRIAALDEDLAHTARVLARRGIELDELGRRIERFQVAIPSWGVGTGGTRFARFPLPGEPRDVFEKLEDCAVVHSLVRCTPNVSLHFPWDAVDDVEALKRTGHALGLGFDAV